MLTTLFKHHLLVTENKNNIYCGVVLLLWMISAIWRSPQVHAAPIPKLQADSSQLEVIADSPVDFGTKGQKH